MEELDLDKSIHKIFLYLVGLIITNFFRGIMRYHHNYYSKIIPTHIKPTKTNLKKPNFWNPT